MMKSSTISSVGFPASRDLQRVDVRERLANGGHAPADAVLPQACGQIVVTRLERREKLPRLPHIKVEPLIERRLESIRPMKGLGDGRLD
jgi:hypothetical protein